jgi:hypothetical protein
MAKKRLGFWFWLAAMALILTAGSSLLAQSDVMLLDSLNGSPEKTRPPVGFPHSLHMEVVPSCKDCHHVYQRGKNVLDEGTLEEGNKELRCSSCHGPKSRIDLRDAYHGQCMGCHRKPLKEQKKIPPRYCGGCHVRN